MKKIFKWIGIVLGGLILVLTCTVFLMNATYNQRLNRTYNIQPASLKIPNDSANVAEGKKWVSNLCTHCHGEQLEGTKFFNDPALGILIAPNLTPAGVTSNYVDADWIRAIRHGAGKNGRPLMIMPSNEFHALSEEHLGQIIAYLKTIPVVEKEWEPSRFTTFAKVLIQLGALGKAFPVEYLDHTAKFKSTPQRKDSRVYGAYLVQVSGCRACHGEQLNGAPNHDPNGPMAPNLTQVGNLPKWGEAGFIKTIRTGTRPDGTVMDQKFMPWKNIAVQDDEALKAIYAYLMAQPKVETPKK
ncbi:c-type cytochrome [Haliscomenobacter sp.]|uniref:c-type cytochrome n=1 Tax=Haliscomenobacter sp. TaxID=2717303 RepID=UPI003BA9EBB6